MAINLSHCLICISCLVRGVRAITGMFGSESSKSTKVGTEVDKAIGFTFLPGRHHGKIQHGRYPVGFKSHVYILKG